MADRSDRNQGRILARKAAYELSPEEIRRVAGGDSCLTYTGTDIDDTDGSCNLP